MAMQNYTPQENALSRVFVHGARSLFLGLSFWAGAGACALSMSSPILALFAEALPPLFPLVLLFARLMAGDTPTW